MLRPKDAIIAKMFMRPKETPQTESPVKVSETGKPVRGNGGARTDEVPAEIVDDEDQTQGSGVPARLSKDEFVIKADVLRKLGKGNPEIGAAILEEMMANILASSEDEIEPNQVPSGLSDLLGA